MQPGPPARNVRRPLRKSLNCRFAPARQMRPLAGDKIPLEVFVWDAPKDIARLLSSAQRSICYLFSWTSLQDLFRDIVGGSQLAKAAIRKWKSSGVSEFDNVQSRIPRIGFAACLHYCFFLNKHEARIIRLWYIVEVFS